MDMREAADQIKAVTEERRVELGKRWKAVYQEAGVSHQTLARWRQGEPVDRLTERGLELALQWGKGARKAIADGQEPQRLEDLAAEEEKVAALSPEEETFRRVVSATARELGLKGADVEEVMRLVREDLEGLPSDPPYGPANGAGDRGRRAG